MKLMRILTFSLLAFLLANCSLEIGVEDISSGPDDFLKSSVIAETIGIADGVTDLVVTIELKNSDDSLIADHTPIISIIAGSATNLGCTASNALGISICRLRASVAGTVTISFDNIQIELTEDVVFEPPSRNGTFLQILSSAQNSIDASGYTVTTQVGAPMEGIHQTSSGYQIFTSSTGAITPTD